MENGDPVCNPCGLYYKLNGVSRRRERRERERKRERERESGRERERDNWGNLDGVVTDHNCRYHEPRQRLYCSSSPFTKA